MTSGAWLPVLTIVFLAQSQAAPVCQSENARSVERIHGTVERGAWFVETTEAGWILRLVPDSYGWVLHVTMKGREEENLARLTPPWHFVPNPREIEGWHFRNSDNTGPNDGSVNAPQEVREFIFSPRVGRDIQGPDAGVSASPEEVEEVRSFGRGWLLIESGDPNSFRARDRRV